MKTNNRLLSVVKGTGFSMSALNLLCYICSRSSFNELLFLLVYATSKGNVEKVFFFAANCTLEEAIYTIEYCYYGKMK